MRTKKNIIHSVVENEESRNKTDSTDFVETLIDNLKVEVEIKYTGCTKKRSFFC